LPLWEEEEGIRLRKAVAAPYFSISSSACRKKLSDHHLLVERNFQNSDNEAKD
jgi:hypothetical protein